MGLRLHGWTDGRRHGADVDYLIDLWLVPVYCVHLVLVLVPVLRFDSDSHSETPRRRVPVPIGKRDFSGRDNLNAMLILILI